MDESVTVKPPVVAGSESQPAADDRASKRLALFGLAGLSAVFVLSVLLNPSDAAPNGQYFTICGFKNLTGLPCPGCGLTHSFCEIVRGHFATALDFHLLGPPLFLLAVLFWLRSVFVLVRWDRPATVFDRAMTRFRIVRLFAYAFAAYGAGRIAYLLIYDPASVRGAPIARLVSWFTG